MDVWLWLTYVGVITALISFPGPVALLCATHGLRFGRRSALATVLGGTLASLIMMVLSAMGLGAILATSETAFLLLKLAGGAYLVFLGIQAWLSQPITPAGPTQEVAENRPIRAPASQLFRRGFAVGISNPKDLLFFAALFPNFITVGEPQLIQFMILALTWLVVDIAMMSGYAVVGSSVGRWLGCPRRMRLFNRASGGVFIAAGGALAVSSQ
ncbi:MULTISPECIES: LysE family translocator [unclassified Halomonas]|uniref:LysE family translocator n=1 Tax=unclassified Halomonas TaxID=2609666 RepID=UPI004025E5D0